MRHGLKFSSIEIRHLLHAWIAISIAFAIVLGGRSILESKFIYYLIISGVTVGTGFLLHELMHKYFAQRYGCWAEFRADYFMLFLAIIMSFIGFVFAAPGAVIIQGTITTKRNGIISMWGPLTNIILAAVFLGFVFYPNALVSEIAKYGLLINAWLAFFNMIPLANIDGAKVWKWNKAVYITLAAAAIGFLVGAFLLIKATAL